MRVQGDAAARQYSTPPPGRFEECAISSSCVFARASSRCCLSLLTSAIVRADGPFRFKAPAGWKDVSSGDTGGVLSKFVQPEFAEQIRKTKYAIYAFDPSAGLEKT